MAINWNREQKRKYKRTAEIRNSRERLKFKFRNYQKHRTKKKITKTYKKEGKL